MKPFYPLGAIPCLLLLWGCNFLARQTTLLCTNRPEFAAYVEAFNAFQKDYMLEIIYDENPENVLTSRENPADLAIYTDLCDPLLIDRFESIDHLFDDQRISPEAFYKDLLVLGKKSDKQYLLPICFNLPAIIFIEDSIPVEVSGSTLSIDSVRKIAISYNHDQNNLFKKMGFSPLWNSDFIYHSAILFGTDFQADPETRTLIWNKDALESAAEYIKNWINEVNGGIEQEDAFKKKYFNIPEYRLLEEERIFFYLTDSKLFLQIPQEKREMLGFRWLSRYDLIPVLDDILFIGILKTASNRPGAKAFLEWFFKAENQRKLLEINRFKKLHGVFGIANGFSSLIEINERDLPQPLYYPIFMGHIPSSELLLFPKSYPKNWRKLKEEIICPLLTEYILSEDKAQGISTLLAGALGLQ